MFPSDIQLLEGFEGYLPVRALRQNDNLSIPEARGVYAVLLPNDHPPEFLDRSTGGRFKVRDPGVPRSKLHDEWVENTRILYFGKAGSRTGTSNLRKRIEDLLQFGSGKSVAHWGGRLLWQLKASECLLIAWRPTNELPRKLEKTLIEQFKNIHDRRPFANLQG